MTCHRIGCSPICTSGFGTCSVSSRSRVPSPPHKITTGMSLLSIRDICPSPFRVGGTWSGTTHNPKRDFPMAESPKPSLVAPRNRSGQKRAIDILPDMLDDARRLGEGTEIDADICVIGAGPAGVTLASEWLTDGFRVVMLESGGAFRKKAAQLLARGESAGQPYYRLERTRVRGFGGTSLHWRAGEGAVRCRPMDPLDFSNRPEVCRKGWPFGREHLDEFYERAHELCFLAPMDYTSEGAHDQPLEQVLLKELVTTREIQIGPTTSFTRRLERFARATNVRLLVNATVISLVCD